MSRERRPGGVVALVATATLAAASLLYLQHRFDEGDRKAALLIVERLRAPGTQRSLAEAILSRDPGAQLRLQATTESSCRQIVRVGAVASHPSGERRVYEFLVDINTGHVVPGNGPGGEAIAWLAGPVASTAPSGAPSPVPSPVPAHL